MGGEGIEKQPSLTGPLARKRGARPAPRSRPGPVATTKPPPVAASPPHGTSLASGRQTTPRCGCPASRLTSTKPGHGCPCAERGGPPRVETFGSQGDRTGPGGGLEACPSGRLAPGRHVAMRAWAASSFNSGWPAEPRERRAWLASSCRAWTRGLVALHQGALANSSTNSATLGNLSLRSSERARWRDSFWRWLNIESG